MTNNNIYFIANWKMFGSLSSVNSINKLIKLSKSKKFKKIKIIYCPPYTLFESFVKKTKKSKISIGAQNCHFASGYGNYTGSISSLMIKKLGLNFVILGHSENRQGGDTSKIINLKIKSALSNNLKVIFCIGETLKDKKNKKTNQVLLKQINHGLKNVKNIEKIIIAYEPVWSIGTGLIPKNKDLQKQIIFLRNVLNKKYRKKKITIIYGGSVKPKNIETLNQINHLNGYLIGGASQKVDNFIDIIKKTIN